MLVCLIAAPARIQEASNGSHLSIFATKTTARAPARTLSAQSTMPETALRGDVELVAQSTPRAG
jgi:hypothetical protein